MRKLCVVTGARSDYGLLYWLLKEIESDSELELQIIVTGMHLSHEFGNTYQRIIDDGFHINEKIEMLLSSDTAVGVTKSIGLGVISFADAFQRLQPDCVILLGDRFETLAAAQAAFIAKIPIAHIHGGEVTMGAYDDGIRHSITKMSHIHFVATEKYKNRVVQLGERPENVHHVGAMVLDSLHNMTFLTKTELEQRLQMSFQDKIFAITYHPETLSSSGSTVSDSFGQLLEALKIYPSVSLVFTKANADTDGRIINDMIDDFCAHHPHAKGFVELGFENYLSLLNMADLVIGNSSSAIIEAPYFKVPSVNIGDRQTGRVFSESIVNSAPYTTEILAAIQKSQSEVLREKILKMPLLYGRDRVAPHIVKVLKNTDMKQIIQKEFYDVGVGWT